MQDFYLWQSILRLWCSSFYSTADSFEDVCLTCFYCIIKLFIFMKEISSSLNKTSACPAVRDIIFEIFTFAIELICWTENQQVGIQAPSHGSVRVGHVFSFWRFISCRRSYLASVPLWKNPKLAWKHFTCHFTQLSEIDTTLTDGHFNVLNQRFVVDFGTVYF